MQDNVDQCLNRVDEFFKKLPFNKINEKSGGKIDVKNKKFKFIVVVFLFALLVAVIATIMAALSLF